MSQQNDLEIRIAAKTDEASIRRANSAMESLADTSEKSVKDISVSGKNTTYLSNAYRELAKSADAYNQELRDIVKSQDAVNSTKPSAATRGGSSTLGGAGAAKGAVRGLLGGSPIAEAADTLGDLSEVAGGLIQSAGGGAQALLSLGAAGAALAVVVGIAAIAMGELNRQAEDQARLIGAQIDSQRQLNTEIASGLTSEQAQEKLSQVNAEYVKQAELLATLESSYKQLTDTFGVASFAVQQYHAGEEELATQLTTQRDLVAGLSADQQNYSAALNDGSLAINDAIAAEQALAAERTKSVLSEASAAGELESARQSTRDKTKEAIQSQIDAENGRIASLQAQLSSLQASGDTSEAVTNQIATLNSQLETARGKVDIFTQSMKGAQTEAQKRSLASAAKETEKLQTSAGRAASQLSILNSSLGGVGAGKAPATSILGIGKRSAAANQAIAKSAAEATKAQEDYANSLIEVNNKLGKGLDDIRLNLSRSVEDLSINTKRSIQDALAEGSFLSIREIQRDSRREMQDLERQANRDRIDAQREGALEILRIEQDLASQRARIAGGGRVSQGGFVALAPR